MTETCRMQEKVDDHVSASQFTKYGNTLFRPVFVAVKIFSKTFFLKEIMKQMLAFRRGEEWPYIRGTAVTSETSNLSHLHLLHSRCSKIT